jgi:hypothetical protein
MKTCHKSEKNEQLKNKIMCSSCKYDNTKERCLKSNRIQVAKKRDLYASTAGIFDSLNSASAFYIPQPKPKRMPRRCCAYRQPAIDIIRFCPNSCFQLGKQPILPIIPH